MRVYSLKGFLRTVPNLMFAEYFTRKGLLDGFDFQIITERKIEPLFDAIQDIEDEKRVEIDTDFQDIFALGYEGGVKLLLDEANYKQIDLLDDFEKLKGSKEKAFFCFLNYKEIFDAALLFSCRDNLQGSWRKLKGLPALQNLDFTDCKDNFENAVGNYFRSEGRGRNCIVDYTRRENLHYFFAYPENYSKADLHYVHGKLKRKNENPVFQVVFIYNTMQGFLDIYHEGSIDTVKRLRSIFAKENLGIEQLIPPQKEAYQIEQLKHNNFKFSYLPEWGINQITIKSITFSKNVRGYNRGFKIKCGDYPQAIYEELDIHAPYNPYDQRPARNIITVDVAEITVEFQQNTKSKKRNKRTFYISKDSCNLKYEGRDLIIRNMLILSKLEGGSEQENNDTNKPIYEPA